MEPLILMPIGTVHNAIASPQDDHWRGVVSQLVIDSEQYLPESLQGIEEFSHLEVIYVMNRVDPSSLPVGARHPRNLTFLPKVGIFAQRPKARPNRIGLSRCRLLSREGMILTVEGLDAIDDSPLIDIKPYFAEFGPRGEVLQPDWTHEVMRNYY
ncbi:SAM-dependent methyltransferase [Caballeronia sp. dw_276]|uniref:SAM-dependent methyltransferase n=1 Tax=Caballeronia sp. dw_276 TaxID=2719795 RepID=UPI00210824CC|nr:SAM-dependent methyltransferase [Caballeronia sp. dw_276]